MKPALRIPAEWERHEACWLAYPYLAEEWAGRLEQAQACVVELCRAIAGPGGEPVRLLVKDERVERAARAKIGDGLEIEYVRADYGDCWVRDTIPLFGHSEDGAVGVLRFEFNGWGRKFEIPFDAEIGRWIAMKVGAQDHFCPVTLEGGALEFDGQGTFLTTASCVLNTNRNPGLTREAFETALRTHVSVERLIWLERGLSQDHTDGHVDMIARFIGKDSVLCMTPRPGAPDAGVLEAVAQALADSGLELIEVPAPPVVHGPDGTPLPATYCNFYLANDAVIVPTYGVPEDEQALAVLGEAFGGRVAIGLPAIDLLCGGGAFHCATQPQPALP